ncbi:MAG TPA: hypothetical protein VMV25_10295 [Steroidobacteraceae bacterium]|nr:hypothetical protein [Steroidobacteraceae bacterium]
MNRITAGRNSYRNALIAAAGLATGIGIVTAAADSEDVPMQPVSRSGNPGTATVADTLNHRESEGEVLR